MKNLHIAKYQEGAVISIEFILISIIAVACTIFVMTTAMDILPVLKHYLKSWVIDYFQTLQHAFDLIVYDGNGPPDCNNGP